MLAQPKLFVFGLGYVGLRVGIAAQEAGYQVCGSVRSAEKAKAIFDATGMSAHTFDLDESYSGLSPSGLEALRQATHLVCTVPPIADLDRDPLLALHQKELLCSAGSPGTDGGSDEDGSGSGLRWMGYLSTTSVYGDHAGAWVTEQSEPRAAPGSAGHNRLAAERAWLDLEAKSGRRLAVRVFRLAGIYGPGRSALDTVARAVAKAPAGEELAPPTRPPPPLPSPLPPTTPAAAAAPSAPPLPPRYVSRIHVDDISAALLASMSQPTPPSPGPAPPPLSEASGDARIFNLADDDPAPRAEVMAFAAELLGAPSRAASDAAGAPSGGSGARARRRATEHKRVSNERLRQTLLPGGLRWPTYREGLRGIREDPAQEA